MDFFCNFCSIKYIRKTKQSDLYEKDKNTFPYGMDLIYSLGLSY